MQYEIMQEKRHFHLSRPAQMHTERKEKNLLSLLCELSFLPFGFIKDYCHLLPYADLARHFNPEEPVGL